jgi:hypothetical protein
LARTSEAYRAGSGNDAAITARIGGGITPRVPIYRELLAELRAALHAAGHRYDQAAEAADIPLADRFDWRRILQGESNAETKGGSDETQSPYRGATSARRVSSLHSRWAVR